MAAAEVLSNGIAKQLVERRRPPKDWIPQDDVEDRPDSSSFPSGHTAAAVAFTAAVTPSWPWAGAACAAHRAPSCCSATGTWNTATICMSAPSRIPGVAIGVNSAMKPVSNAAYLRTSPSSATGLVPSRRRGPATGPSSDPYGARLARDGNLRSRFPWRAHGHALLPRRPVGCGSGSQPPVGADPCALRILVRHM
ncbi:phosphatase PAP2 family protein [Streptomyces sp. NBC_01353]|uniref:phosphatase PAP2 family protein n=1 Tax=Streptomyces sp. NBC_01353 TaxID=2903835 RepID=UPI002E3089F5|nr:phosphatase PAP2 family protein [Streptomyces sp. NBC_01353]